MSSVHVHVFAHSEMRIGKAGLFTNPSFFEHLPTMTLSLSNSHLPDIHEEGFPQ